jgi:predicted heme/steroid binding protein
MTTEYTLEDIKSHNKETDLWVAWHGRVLNLSKFVFEHPGGVDVMMEVAGNDVTQGFKDIGHSQDAIKLAGEHAIGVLKGAVVKAETPKVIGFNGPRLGDRSYKTEEDLRRIAERKEQDAPSRTADSNKSTSLSPSLMETDSLVLKQIFAIYTINQEIIERLKKYSQENPESYVIYGRLIVFDPKTRTIRLDESKLPSSQIITNWSPITPCQFSNTAEMNLFNDNIIYTVSNFEDLIRLNSKIKEVAVKFTWLDPKKAEPVLKLFKDNMEVLQTLLGEVEGLTLSPGDDGRQELFQRAEELEAQLKALEADIATWNTIHGPPHQHPRVMQIPARKGGIRPNASNLRR